MAPGSFPIISAPGPGPGLWRPANPWNLPHSSWRNDFLILESTLELSIAPYCLHQADGQWKHL